MKITRTWLISGAVWLYLLVGLFLYAVLRVEWVKTFDFLFGFVILLAASIWYVMDRLLHGKGQTPRNSNWVIDPWGIHHRGAFKKYQKQKSPRG
jgi:hypothetical protein